MVSNSEEAQEEEDQPDDAIGDELQDVQSDDESLKILGGVDKLGPTEALVTQEKGKVVEMEPASKVTRLKRPSDSRMPQTQE